MPKVDSYRYAGVGLHFAATIAVFGWGGYWLDGKLGTLPLFLVVGAFLGFGLGTKSLVARLTPKRAPEEPLPSDSSSSMSATSPTSDRESGIDA